MQKSLWQTPTCLHLNQTEQATIYKITMHLYIYTQKLQVYRYFLLCRSLMWLYRKRNMIYFKSNTKKALLPSLLSFLKCSKVTRQTGWWCDWKHLHLPGTPVHQTGPSCAPFHRYIDRKWESCNFICSCCTRAFAWETEDGPSSRSKLFSLSLVRAHNRLDMQRWKCLVIGFEDLCYLHLNQSPGFIS